MPSVCLISAGSWEGQEGSSPLTYSRADQGRARYIYLERQRAVTSNVLLDLSSSLREVIVVFGQADIVVLYDSHLVSSLHTTVPISSIMQGEEIQPRC